MLSDFEAADFVDMVRIFLSHTILHLNFIVLCSVYLKFIYTIFKWIFVIISSLSLLSDTCLSCPFSFTALVQNLS